MPKSIFEKFSEVINLQTEHRNTKEPSAADDPAGFLEYGAKKREIDKKVSYYDHGLRICNLTVDQLKNAIAKTIGAEEAAKLYNSLNKESQFHIFAKTEIFEKNPELYNLLTKKQKAKLNDDPKFAIQYTEQLIKSGKITQEFFEEKKVDFMLIKTARYENRLPFVKNLEGEMTEEQKNTLNEYLDAYAPTNDLPFEEQVTHPFHDRVEELKAAADKNDKEYIEALEYADKHITLVKDDVKAEKEAYESNINAIEARRMAKLHQDNLPTYQDGKFNDLYNITSIGTKTFQTVRPERTNDYNDLINGKLVISDKTKEGMKRMLHKMEEMKLADAAYDKTGEDGEKIYGHAKLYKSKLELVNALKAGDRQKIIDAKKEYEKNWKDMEELYSIAREYFSQDPSFFPGNVDGTRNSSLSWEFTNDVMTTSQVNTIFLLHMHLKSTGMNPDDYVDNPTKGFYDNLTEMLKPYTFEETSKNVSFDTSLKMLFGIGGNYSDPIAPVRANLPINGIGRVVNSGIEIESDPELQKGNIVFAESYTQIFYQLLESIGSKFGYIKDLGMAGEDQHQRQLETLKNLLVTPDKDRNPNAMLSGLPETDIYGRVIGESFDRSKYIQNNPADYKGIIERFNVLLKRVADPGKNLEAGQTTCINKYDCYVVMNDVAKEILTAKIADKDNPEYKALQVEFLSLIDKLPANTPKEVKDALKKDRADYLNAISKSDVKGGYEHLEEIFDNKKETITREKVNTQQDYDNYNVYFQLNAAYSDSVITLSQNNDKYMEALEGNNDISEGIEVERAGDVYGPYIADDLGTRRYDVKTEGKEVSAAYNYVKQKNKYAQEAAESTDSVRKSFSSNTKLSIMLSDIENGNYFQAQSENPYIAGLGTNVSGAGPDIFNSYSGIDPTLIRDYMQANGIKRPLMEVFEAGSDLVQSEYNKQKAMKSGWDISKENKYLAQLSEGFEKFISNFEKLQKLPEELQKKQKVQYYGNFLGHITGMGTNDEGRSLVRFVEGMKWMNQGIKNGWSSRDIHALNLVGMLDGMIQLKKYQAEFDNNLDELEKLSNWEKENLLPVKEKLMGMKVSSPVDVLEALYTIKDLANKTKATSFLSGVYKSSIGMGDDVVLANCINGCKEDMHNSDNIYYSSERDPEKIFTRRDLSEQLKSFSDTIRSGELPEKAIYEIAGAYLMDRFLHGKNIYSNPELFDEKYPDYKAATDRLVKDSKRYAKELLDGLKTKNKDGKLELPPGNEIADILEYGDHNPVFSSMKSRIDASISRSYLQAFVNGTPDRRRNDVSIEEVKEAMYKGKEGVISFNTRFTEVLDGIEVMDKLRIKIGKKAVKQYKEGKDISISQKDLKEYKREIVRYYKIANSYLADKDELIRKAGGDPKNEADIDKLGKNGAKRYRAMKKAKRAIVNMHMSVSEYEARPFTDTQRIVDNHISDDFKVDSKNLRQEMIREKLREWDNRAREISLDEAKYRLEETRKYHALMKQREQELKTNKLNKPRYDALVAIDKKQYEDKILSSARKTLFVESVRSVYTNKANEDMMKNVSYKDAMKTIDDFGKAVKDFTKVEKNGVKFKEYSPQYEAFKKTILKSGAPFSQEFEKAVRDNTGKSLFKQTDIIKLRDETTKKILDSAKTTEEKEKYNAFQKTIGFGTAEQSIERMKEQEAAEKAKALEEANKKNNKVADKNIKK